MARSFMEAQFEQLTNYKDIQLGKFGRGLSGGYY